jgi:hypothetical protein
MRSALSRSHSFLVPFYPATFDSRRSICTNSAKMIFLWWPPLFYYRRKTRKFPCEPERNRRGLPGQALVLQPFSAVLTRL